MIPLSSPFISDEMIQKAGAVITSGKYILGEESQLLEKEFSRYIGTKYGILTSSGTSALMLSLASLGIQQGDEVIVPSHTAFPTVEAIFHTGARPRFVDIADHYTIDPACIEEQITPRTKAIIPVHLYGHPCDMDPILEIAEKHDLVVVEDACQAHGAQWKGRRVGSIGDAGCFSFYPSKNMAVAGDGGIVVTDREEIADKIRMLRDHGRKNKYENELIGYNLRFNEIQAAIGRIQLKGLEGFNASRRHHASVYEEHLAGLPLQLPREADGAFCVYHLYVIRSEKRDALATHLQRAGIQTGIHYPIPCHLQPAITAVMEPVRLARTEEVVKEILSLPMFPSLKEGDISFITDAIRAFFARSSHTGQ